MHRRTVRGILTVFMLVVVMAALALAAEKKTTSQTITGMIEGVNIKKTTLTLKTSDGKTRQLKVAKNLLEGLKTGDHVKVEMVGKKVHGIQKEMAMEKKS